MIQLEFPLIRTLFRAVRPLRCPRRERLAIDYTLRLSAALRVLNLNHSIHDVLCAVAKLQSEQGYATIPAICLRLSCTYQAVMQHFLKNPDLFRRDEAHKPARYTLTPEAIRLMAAIKKRLDRTP